MTRTGRTGRRSERAGRTSTPPSQGTLTRAPRRDGANHLDRGLPPWTPESTRDCDSSSLILSATRTVGRVPRFIGVVLADCLGPERRPAYRGCCRLLPTSLIFGHGLLRPAGVSRGVQAASRLARRTTGPLSGGRTPGLDPLRSGAMPRRTGDHDAEPGEPARAAVPARRWNNTGQPVVPRSRRQDEFRIYGITADSSSRHDVAHRRERGVRT